MDCEVPTSHYLVNKKNDCIQSNTESFLVLKNQSKELLKIKIEEPNTNLK